MAVGKRLIEHGSTLSLGNAQINSSRASFSEVPGAICFIFFCLMPFEFLPNAFSGAVLLSLALISIFSKFHLSVLFNRSFLFLTFLIAMHSGISLFSVENFEFYLQQANGYWQFIALYVAFSCIIKGRLWISILKSPVFFILLILASAINLVPRYLQGGGFEVHIISLPILMIFLRCFIVKDDGDSLSLAAHIALAICVGMLVSRATLLAVILVFPVILYYNPRSLFVKAACTAALLGPAIFYILADNDWIYYWQFNDFNTAIRAEFIKGAMGGFAKNLFFGIGFDAPYRDMHYPYVLNHILLNNHVAVNSISNHNSFFDIGLRLGLPASVAMYFLVVIRPDLSSEFRFKAFLMIFVCLSMGSNASLEDQNEILSVIMAMAILNEVGRKVPPRMSGNWKPRRNVSFRLNGDVKAPERVVSLR